MTVEQVQAILQSHNPYGVPALRADYLEEAEQICHALEGRTLDLLTVEVAVESALYLVTGLDATRWDASEAAAEILGLERP